MNKTFLLIAGGAVALYFFSRASLANKLNFLLANIRPGGNLLQPSIILTITVQNPTNQRATLKSISGQLDVNGKYVANISSFGDQVIAPRGETNITITARPSAIGIFSSIRDILTNPTGTNVAALTGNANVDGVTYPINITNNL